MQTFISFVVTVIFMERFTRSQVVVQSPIEFDKYCPDKNSCEPAHSHLVCRYDHNLSTSCFNYVEHKITATHVTELLSKLNSFRIAVANDKAVGAEKLPKAYGMMRLQWDNELAGMAQFLVNQCTTFYDYVCATTDKFSNTIPIYFLRKKDIPVEDVANFKSLDVSTLLAAVPVHINTSLKRVNASDIHSCPKLIDVEINERNNRYIKIVQGSATHIGCGQAQFEAQHLRNLTHAVIYAYLRCYVSFSTKSGEQVYNMTPPRIGSGFSNKCGCPPYHREVNGCLCEEYRPITDSTPPVFYQPVYLNKRIRGPTEPHRTT